jgi:uncharacterized protein YodC (DUF2158 family)
VTEDGMKLGHVVRLRCGGPDMTIIRDPEEGKVTCRWFDNESRIHTDYFPAGAANTTSAFGVYD